VEKRLVCSPDEVLGWLLAANPAPEQTVEMFPPISVCLLGSYFSDAVAPINDANGWPTVSMMRV